MASTPIRTNSDPSVATPVSRHPVRTSLNAAALPPATKALLGCSLLGSLLFTATYLVEGATRPGYDAWQQAISALSLGPGGWMQQLNFVVFGVLVLASAVGWRRALRGGHGAVLAPVLQVVTGIGLIVDGFFSQDPAPGYPPGALVTAPTLHGTIHLVGAVACISALAFRSFVFAWRFAIEPGWRAWAPYSVVTGLLTIVFIAAFGAAGAHGGLAGLDERVAIGVHSLWDVFVITRLIGLRSSRPPKKRPGTPSTRSSFGPSSR